MKKIPTIFERDWQGDRSRVLNKPNKECDWVFRGDGHATIKFDGTCCMIRDGKLYKRRELKDDVIPEGFESVGYDEETKKTVGWMPIGDGPEDKYHREAWEKTHGRFIDGTYELVGPKVQGGVEGRETQLIRHGEEIPLIEPFRDFDSLVKYFDGTDMEGLVFHHPDGRMAKIKLRDFGLRRVKTVKTGRIKINELMNQ